MTERDALYAAVCQHPLDDTPRLIFADYLDENGESDRAEFVRTQLRLALVMAARPGHNGGFSTGMRDPMREWREEISALRTRERELFTAHGAEWFGNFSTLQPPGNPGPGGPPMIVVARGFPAHWYGPWSAWVGGACQNCDGRGWIRQHSSEARSRTPDDGLDCDHCKGSGRIPGAWERAWKPSWTMECGRCSGIGRIEKNGSDHRCHDCWNTPGRIPRPMPGDAWPVTEVTLTTMPESPERGYTFSDSDEARQHCEATWTDIAFHLPDGA